MVRETCVGNVDILAKGTILKTAVRSLDIVRMGNSHPHNIKDEYEANVSKKKYIERLAKELNAIHISVEEEKGAALFFNEKYYIAVSYGCSSKVGIEFTLRYLADTKEKAIEIFGQIGMIFGMFITMQENSKFRPNETAELVTPLNWETICHGTQGCGILLDTSLKGLNSNGDNSFNEDGPLHDGDFWPQHFLLLFPLRAAEYRFTNAVNASRFLPLVGTVNPNFVTDFSRDDLMNHPTLETTLQELLLTTPSRTVIDGLSLDIRVRKNGNCVDFVVGPRCMAPILEALEQAYMKPSVPLRTLVIAQADGLACEAGFYCHDIHKDNELIRPETAYYKIVPQGYANGTTQEIVKLSPSLMKQYCFLTPGDLWRQYGLIRMIHAEFFFTAAMLRDMISHVRAAVMQQMTDGTWDPDNNPVILEFPNQFIGLNGKSGILLPNEEVSTVAESVSTPARWRLICAGMSYFDDEMYIDDEGIFHRNNDAEEGQAEDEEELDGDGDEEEEEG